MLLRVSTVFSCWKLAVCIVCLGLFAPPAAAQLASPFGIAVDSAGNVYIADSANHRVVRVDTAGTITAFAGTGMQGDSGDNGPATTAQLASPYGVGVDSAGNVYIADTANHRIRRVDTAGTITAFAGTGTPGDSGDNGPATAAQLASPLGVGVDSAGNVYIADSLNHRIRRVDTAGTITAFAGAGIQGDSGDNGPATAAQLAAPAGIAVDSAGNVYIADSANHRTRRVDTAGIITTLYPSDGLLENPSHDSFQSGIGVISGWVCEAEEVVIELNGQLMDAAYPTERLDTEEVCGDTDNGFGLLVNWNRLGDGTHTVRALVDGVLLGQATVTVTTLGEEFLEGVSGTYVLDDFPSAGTASQLVWQEALQNFVLAPVGSEASVSEPATRGMDSLLENPSHDSFQSGIGVISGWVCEAEEVVIELNGQPMDAAYPTEWLDTEEECGDTDNGFGLLVNWNRLGDGEHMVVAFADGEEIGRATMTVTTLGEEFVRGVSGEYELADFPTPGQTVTVEWQQSLQNFTISLVE